MYKIITVCAWCNVILESRRIEGLDKDIISHGICQKCADSIKRSILQAQDLDHQR